MKVLFDHPNPFFLAHGGFQTQIEQTKQTLESVGVEVEWLRWWDDKQKGDLIHYFGRAHPGYIRQAQGKGIKVVMSELLTGLGSRGAMSRKLQKLCMIVASRVLPKEFTARLCWDAYQIADGCIANTSWEKKLMVDMFSAKADQVHVVPNGVEDVFFRDSKSQIQNQKSEICKCSLSLQHFADRFLQYGCALNQSSLLFRPKLDFNMALHARAADDGWDREADISNSVCTIHQAANRQNSVIVESNAVDNIGDRDTHREASSALLLDDFCPAAASLLFDFGNQSRIDAREFFQRDIGNLSSGPDWNHAVAMLTEDRDVDLRRRNSQSLSQHASQPCRVEHSTEPDDL